MFSDIRKQPWNTWWSSELLTWAPSTCRSCGSAGLNFHQLKKLYACHSNNLQTLAWQQTAGSALTQSPQANAKSISIWMSTALLWLSWWLDHLWLNWRWWKPSENAVPSLGYEMGWPHTCPSDWVVCSACFQIPMKENEFMFHKRDFWCGAFCCRPEALAICLCCAAVCSWAGSSNPSGAPFSSHHNVIVLLMNIAST